MEIDLSGGASNLCSASVGVAVEIHHPETSVVVEDEVEGEERENDAKSPTSPQRKVTFALPGEQDVTDGEPHIGYSAGIFVQEVDEGQPCDICKERCPGFSRHRWRSICVNCKCPREAHDIYHEDFVNVRDRLGWPEHEDPLLQVDKEKTLCEGYAWTPPGLSSEKIMEYMSQLPNDKVPKLGTPGEKKRNIQLIYQLPKQDLSEEYCRSLTTTKMTTPQVLQSFHALKEKRDEEAMDIAFVQDNLKEDMVCYSCEGEIEANDMAIFAPKFGPDICWHLACFMCQKCDQELLVDLVYCYHDGQIFCERHYAEQMKPRCAGCDELIFCGEYTKAMEQDWHSGHFCCHNCDQSLTGKRYILRDDHPYCIKCYEDSFANSCEECKKPIGTDSKDLSYKEKHWHENCFKCADCQCSLVDKHFAAKNEKLYCPDCHDNNFAPRCDCCGDVFKAGMKKFEYKNKQWHETCFCCLVCKQPIGSKSFIPKDNDVVCIPCYEDQFAQRCLACNGVINKGGVTYKNSPFHRECFVCNNCKKELAGLKFTSKDEQPYCAECYGDLYAKKCCRCTKPITGIGSTKFISFEERHWHSDCFNCYKCNVSLVSKGFLTDGEDILCPTCGKN
ncbi:prickle planar cell polarity protein 3-A-like isoform X2 [Lineus longissimus]|uniref:prickle planar cell polarity protein 3-A-like isoform X2 n=1 Tax=Lineus longissimus TaxID=88925 RepID=UPI002B4E4005